MEILFASDGRQIHPADVLCGRGKQSFNHPGNKRFRDAISRSLHAYMNAETRYEKSLVVQTIIEYVEKAGGRFLKQKGGEESGEWHPLTQPQAKEKVGHAIRDAYNSAESRKKKRREKENEQEPPSQMESQQRHYDSFQSFPPRPLVGSLPVHMHAKPAYNENSNNNDNFTYSEFSASAASASSSSSRSSRKRRFEEEYPSPDSYHYQGHHNTSFHVPPVQPIPYHRPPPPTASFTTCSSMPYSPHRPPLPSRYGREDQHRRIYHRRQHPNQRSDHQSTHAMDNNLHFHHISRQISADTQMHSHIHRPDAPVLHHVPTATSTPIARRANETPTHALAPSPIQAQSRSASATMFDDDTVIHRMSSNSTSPLSLAGIASVTGVSTDPPRPTTVRIANARKILKPSPIQENVYRPSFPMIDNPFDDNSWRQSPIKTTTTTVLGEDERSTRSYDTHRSRHSFY